MQRPSVTIDTLTSKVAEGNLTHWLHYLKADFDQFVAENRDLMGMPQKLASIDVSDFILRCLEDDAVKDLVFKRTPASDTRIFHYLNTAVEVLNQPTVQAALQRLSDTSEA